MIKLYKIKWLENIGKSNEEERIAYVLADHMQQITNAYPTLTFAEESATIRQDLRSK